MKQLKATKQFFLLSLIIACTFTAHARVFDFANIFIKDTVPELNIGGQPVTQNSLLINDPNDTIIENRLVELALAQPGYRQTIYEQKILEYQMKNQRNSWLNLLSFSTTYNDQSFAKQTNATYVYPKFYIGINIPLGLFVTSGTDVKISKQSELIAKEQQAELAKTIKANVISNYKQYKANEKLIAIENQALDDEQANFLQVEQKFKSGTATLEEYNEASKKYNDEQVRIITLKLQEDLIKVELERLIGMRLEDALKMN